MAELIDRQAAIAYAISGRTREFEGEKWIRVSEVRESIQAMPPALPEPLTDIEQRIFLAAMGREYKICKKADEEYYGIDNINLVRVCREIERKVKKALWKN